MAPAVKLGLGVAWGPWWQRAGVAGQMALGPLQHPGSDLLTPVCGCSFCGKVLGSSTDSTFSQKQR